DVCSSDLSFDVKRLTDPEVRALMQKVRVIAQEEFIGWYPKAMPSRVTVRTASGNEYVKQVDYPLGHPRNPLSDREIEEKFRSLSTGLFDRARAGKVIDMVWKLETLKDLGAWMPLVNLSSAPQ